MGVFRDRVFGKEKKTGENEENDKKTENRTMMMRRTDESVRAIAECARVRRCMPINLKEKRD